MTWNDWYGTYMKFDHGWFNVEMMLFNYELMKEWFYVKEICLTMDKRVENMMMLVEGQVNLEDL